MFKYTSASKEEELGLNTRDYTEEQLQRFCRSSPGERRVVGPLTRNLRAAGSAWSCEKFQMPSLRRPSQKTITSDFPLTVRVFQLLVVLFTQTPDEGSLWQAVTLICKEAESSPNNVHRVMHSATGWLNMLHPVVLHYNDLQNLCQLENLLLFIMHDAVPSGKVMVYVFIV